jgi:hypothetical protein
MIFRRFKHTKKELPPIQQTIFSTQLNRFKKQKTNDRMHSIHFKTHLNPALKLKLSDCQFH